MTPEETMKAFIVVPLVVLVVILAADMVFGWWVRK